MRRTFLGMPATAPVGVGQLRGEEPFPAAARRALGDEQLRRNLGHATATIRAKSGAVIGEVPDWEQLRAAGSAIKADVLARLPELLEQLEQRVSAAGEWCTGRLTRTRRTRSSWTWCGPPAVTG
ncbi:hypothetical protein GCM10029963_01610 [Micromonospora andamanensis]